MFVNKLKSLFFGIIILSFCLWLFTISIQAKSFISDPAITKVHLTIHPAENSDKDKDKNKDKDKTINSQNINLQSKSSGLQQIWTSIVNFLNNL